MKTIAIFCDGTWQNFGQPNPTNVSRLARATLRSDANGRQQVIRYDDGVGVGQGVVDHLTSLVGGAFGKGLDYKLARAYEFLCLNYEPGDRLYMFGFSRGAYTVRSLAGLVRQMWILRADACQKVPEAIDLYRSRPREPDMRKMDERERAKAKAESDAATAAWKAKVTEFNAKWAHPIANAFVDDKPYDPRDPASLEPADVQACGWIQFVGVWDTVGSLGIPSSLPFADLVDDQYQFHDLGLSRFVRSARHAVALDERRETFKPTLWSNVPELNTNAQADQRPYSERPYQQQWFPGGHGSVGGGGASPVALAPLLWIAEGAARAGLALDPNQLALFKQEADATADFDPERSDLGSVALRAIGAKWRDGPSDLDLISTSARVRLNKLNTYEPHSLKDDILKAVRGGGLPNPLNWFNP